MSTVPEPLGDVTVRVGKVKAKSLSLVLSTDGSVARLTRRRAFDVAGPVTIHERLPIDAGTPAATRVHVAPLSRLTSMFTSSPGPRLCAHVIACVVPIVQLTPVFGAVSVIRSTTLKFTSLMS